MFHSVNKVDDSVSGYYYDPTQQKCRRCQTWQFDKKDCAKKDGIAENEDCHQKGENGLNKKCFDKRIKKGTEKKRDRGQRAEGT